MKYCLFCKLTLEDLRDIIRALLHANYPDEFSWGQVGTSVGTLTYTMLAAQDVVACSQLECTNCAYKGQKEMIGLVILSLPLDRHMSPPLSGLQN